MTRHDIKKFGELSRQEREQEYQDRLYGEWLEWLAENDAAYEAEEKKKQAERDAQREEVRKLREQRDEELRRNDPEAFEREMDRRYEEAGL